jgi:hypothetical protein
VICIAREVVPELIALQHEAERVGMRLHVVPGPRALVGLVTGNDELIVFTEGLLAAPQEAIACSRQAKAYSFSRSRAALPRGFERIDINHRRRRLMRIPGRLVEGLSELPPTSTSLPR